jgi:hypothetical protein
MKAKRIDCPAFTPQQQCDGDRQGQQMARAQSPRRNDRVGGLRRLHEFPTIVPDEYFSTKGYHCSARSPERLTEVTAIQVTKAARSCPHSKDSTPRGMMRKIERERRKAGCERRRRRKDLSSSTVEITVP